MSGFRDPAPTNRCMTATAVVLSIGSMAYGLQYTWGPMAWHQTTAQKILASLSIPFSVYGICLLVGGVLGLFCRTRPIGFVLSGIVFGFFAIALFEQTVFGSGGWIHHGFTSSPPPSVFVGTGLLAVLYFSACWSALQGDHAKNFHLAVRGTADTTTAISTKRTDSA